MYVSPMTQTTLPDPIRFDIEVVYPFDLTVPPIPGDDRPRIIDRVRFNVYLCPADNEEGDYRPYVTYSFSGPTVLKNGKPGKDRTGVSIPHYDAGAYASAREAVLPLLTAVLARLSLTPDEVDW